MFKVDFTDIQLCCRALALMVASKVCISVPRYLPTWAVRFFDFLCNFRKNLIGKREGIKGEKNMKKYVGTYMYCIHNYTYSYK